MELEKASYLSGNIHNFRKSKLKYRTSLGSPYDYNSIMHYPRTAFSKNGKPTIQAIGDPKKPIGQRKGLSTEDILQLDELYKCKGAAINYFSTLIL